MTRDEIPFSTRIRTAVVHGIVCVCVSASVASAGGGEGRADGPRQIIFDRSGEDWREAEVYSIDPDGARLKRLTHTSGEGKGSGAPDWSPDGKRIVFCSNRDATDNLDENWDIYVMDADGSSIERLTRETGWDCAPAWCPDATKIAFVSKRSGEPLIYVMKVDGSNVRRLSAPNRPGYQPAWSPDGKRIAYIAKAHGRWEVHVMDADGSNVQQLTRGMSAGAAAWSPDGTKIAFDSDHHGNFEIFLMNTDGSHVRRLTHDDKVDARPAWSPDGRNIVFHSTRHGSSSAGSEQRRSLEILVMDADGSHVRRLTSNGDCDAHPDW